MASTAVMAVAAAAVLAVGIQDAHVLRLGLAAALWAALFGAFATARVRREITSYAHHADQLRTVYQLELEREVAARREHMLTVEHALRERAELSQRSEIVDLRAELAAVRANLEQLLGGSPMMERVTLRAESTRLLPLPAEPRTYDDGRNRAAATVVNAAPAMISTTRSVTAAEHRFGPGRSQPSAWVPAPSLVDTATSGRRLPALSGNGSHHNGSHHNGSHHNGSRGNGSRGNDAGARQAAAEVPSAASTQRTVSDLLAAHGVASPGRRRHSQDETRPA
jgi:hypothetical protein